MKFPPVPAGVQDSAVASYLRSLTATLTRLDSKLVKRDEAVGSVLLTSPNGSVYRIKVANDGTIISEVATNE